MSQYIGELCRYLLTQKPCEEEKQHKLRMMIGMFFYKPVKAKTYDFKYNEFKI